MVALTDTTDSRRNKKHAFYVLKQINTMAADNGPHHASYFQQVEVRLALDLNNCVLKYIPLMFVVLRRNINSERRVETRLPAQM